ncbi:hypothetical protein [Luteolibacter sp. AS25]|uniref:hypothetical protein n=1 Tax=Luteolibacter sp. AS25 TaxID=3135776 RepID=UPI00398A944A
MLEEWITARRDRFTCADFNFLNEVLAGGQKRGCLLKLWNDPGALREMLDLKEVFRSILDSPSTLSLSADFYFYILVRHAFLQAGITRPDMADYVSRVMAQRLTSGRDPLQDIARGYTHTSDFLSIISSSHGKMKFHLQVAAGNQFMVLTGLFPAFITKRNELHNAPDLKFYESFAQCSFKNAASNPKSSNTVPRELLGALSETLPDARRSLNRVAEEFVFLGE